MGSRLTSNLAHMAVAAAAVALAAWLDASPLVIVAGACVFAVWFIFRPER
jgi:hypothetical protein